jgi:hypothetical protein
MAGYALIDSGDLNSEQRVFGMMIRFWFQFCTRAHYRKDWEIIYLLHVVCQANYTTIYINLGLDPMIVQRS